MSANVQIGTDGRTATGTAVVSNAAGIHCRPSAVIVKEARAFDDDAVLTANGMSADPKSAIELLSLALEQGCHVEVRAEGPTAEVCCRKLIELLETEFDFPKAADG